MRASLKTSCAAALAAMAAAFASGCGGDVDKPQNVDKPQTSVSAQSSVSAEKIAALEKDVVRLKGELQQLRHQLEKDAKMRSRAAMNRPPYGPDRNAANLR